MVLYVQCLSHLGNDWIGTAWRNTQQQRLPCQHAVKAVLVVTVLVHWTDIDPRYVNARQIKPAVDHEDTDTQCLGFWNKV